MPARDRGDDAALSDAFWSVARELRHQSRESLEPWDISPAQLRAMRTVGHHGAMRLGDLAEHLRIAARSATEVVDALETRGLLERRRDPADRRATLVDVTAEGHELMAALRARRSAETDAYFGTLTRAQREQLLTLLQKLLDRP